MPYLDCLIFYNLPLIQLHWTKKKLSHFSALNSASLYIAIILLDKRNTFKDSIPCEVFHGSKTNNKKKTWFLVYSSLLITVLNLETTWWVHVVLVSFGQMVARKWLGYKLIQELFLYSLIHTYSFFWKQRFFSLLSKKISVQKLCFFFSDWKWHHLWWEQCMRFYWYPTPRNKPPLYMSTAKQRFQKYPLWKAFWKDALSVTLFTGYVWMVG